MTNSDLPEWEDGRRLRGLSVCLTCFGLRGRFGAKEHRCSCEERDDAWREREWSDYDLSALVDLCNLCARGTMKSGSRYTWLVCDECRSVNAQIGSVFGARGVGALPVGRHSLMNRIALGGTEITDERIAGFSAWLLGLTKIWIRLLDWRTTEARSLADGAGQKGESVPLKAWLQRFPSSTGASVDAFCRFVEYDLPEHPQLERLREARSSFLAGASTG